MEIFLTLHHQVTEMEYYHKGLYFLIQQKSNISLNFQFQFNISFSRGANGGTIYVNSLGQLSTDKDSGFDEKNSFILRPDKDSTFDQDFRVPSNSFDNLKGIGNSYSFGIPGSNVPLRGSEDLSEPVDPAELTRDRYLPPRTQNQNIPKQIYTYPNDATRNNQQNFSPEYTGQINTKLSANSPKFKAPQGIYGPAISLYPGSNSNIQHQSNQRPTNVRSQQRFENPQQKQQQQQQQQRKLAQIPPNSNAQKSPIKLYQQPVQQLARQQPQPQPFRPKGQTQLQTQSQQFDRRNFNVNPSNNKNHHRQQHQSHNINRVNNGNQSNESFLRTLLKDMTHVHNDKSKLIELIQRLFVPASTNMRVVSADVYASQPSASYEFTYNGDSSTSHQHTHQHSHHQRSGNCGQ
jgi:hypothetical protein